MEVPSAHCICHKISKLKFDFIEKLHIMKCTATRHYGNESVPLNWMARLTKIHLKKILYTPIFILYQALYITWSRSRIRIFFCGSGSNHLPKCGFASRSGSDLFSKYGSGSDLFSKCGSGSRGGGQKMWIQPAPDPAPQHWCRGLVFTFITRVSHTLMNNLFVCF